MCGKAAAPPVPMLWVVSSSWSMRIYATGVGARAPPNVTATATGRAATPVHHVGSMQRRDTQSDAHILSHVIV